MDTDDFYNKEYISESIYNLLDTGKSISGTSAMLMYSNNQYYKLNCLYLHALNEATICIDTFKIKFRFNTTMTSEGLEPLKLVIGQIVETNIFNSTNNLFVFGLNLPAPPGSLIQLFQITIPNTITNPVQFCEYVNNYYIVNKNAGASSIYIYSLV
jgi:hypothetical protein